jgi:ribosomal protein S27AE
MSNELKNELKVELSCGRCNFTKVVTVNLDEDGVFTIPNKFCPNDLSELEREVLRQFVSVPESKPDEPTEDKTRVSNPLPKPARPVDLPKHGANSSKKT